MAEPNHVVILDLHGLRDIGRESSGELRLALATAAVVVVVGVEQGVVLVLAHAQSSLQADLDRHCLTDVIGADHIFDSLREVLAVIRETRVHAMEVGTSGAGWKSVE